MGEIVPDVETKVQEGANAMGFAAEALKFEQTLCLAKSGESGKDCKGAVAQKDKRGRNL